MKKLETIFEEEMERSMIKYSSEEFKKDYPTLRAAIFNMMQTCIQQTLAVKPILNNLVNDIRRINII